MTRKERAAMLGGIAVGILLSLMVASCVAAQAAATTPRPAQPVSGLVPWPSPFLTPLRRPMVASVQPPVTATPDVDGGPGFSPTVGPSVAPPDSSAKRRVPAVRQPAAPSPAATPKPSPRPALSAAPSFSGTASWGCCWPGVVTRLPQGTPIRVCGPLACWYGRSVGYGPAAWTGRVADLSRAVFAAICGDPSIGLCRVEVTR